jgi:GNAT superfamily N-acetyltransferase
VDNLRTFVDRAGGVFEIGETCAGVEAAYQGKRVGLIGIAQVEEHHGYDTKIFYRLQSMDVDDRFRNRGVATEMMKLIVDLYGADLVFPQYTAIRSDDSSAYLTDDGLKFIQACVRKGILKPQKRGS